MKRTVTLAESNAIDSARRPSVPARQAATHPGQEPPLAGAILRKFERGDKPALKKFQTNPKHPHKRSEGVTARRNAGTQYQSRSEDA